MNEIELLRRCDTSSEITDERLAALRQTFIRAINSEVEQRPARLRQRRLRMPAPAWMLVPITAIVALIAIGVVIATGGRNKPGDTLQAGPFLHEAALVALTTSATPTPDQFLYVRDGAYQAWLSMDGMHDGKIIDSTGSATVVAGCVNGRQALFRGTTPTGTTAPCAPDPAYVADAPTTPDAMRAYLINRFGDVPNALGKGLITILQSHYLNPQARAALYEVAPSLPGLQMSIAPVRNANKQAALLTWTFGTEQISLAFDVVSHQYLGVVINSGVADTNNLQVSQGIVNGVGQTP